MSNQPAKKIPPGAKIGLALGGGAARGLSHLGVIKALTGAGLDFHCIAGTSIGALMGAVYACGGIDTLHEVALQVDWMRMASFLDIGGSRSGLLSGRRVTEFLHDYLKSHKIEELPILFGAVATDLETGHEVALRDGDVIEAVRASISIPGIFRPVKKLGMTLVDGGLVNPVPVNLAREMGAEYVIAVDLNHYVVGGQQQLQPPPPSLAEEENGMLASKVNRLLKELSSRFDSVEFTFPSFLKERGSREAMPNIFEVLITSINIMETQITRSRLESDPPDLLIQPQIGDINFMEFNRAQEAIAEGYRAAKSKLEGLLF